VSSKEIKNRELINKNGCSTTLDMIGFARGMYFVQITDANKNVVNKKVIKE